MADGDRMRRDGRLRDLGGVRAVGWAVMETTMLDNQKLDQLDRLSAGVLIDLSPEIVQQFETTLDAYEYADGPTALTEFAGVVPQLTAEIRRCWAELNRGNQAGIIDILKASREATCG